MRNYILLSQTLPISFAVSLFLIQLHLSSPDIAPAQTSKDPATPVAAPQRRKPIASLQLPNILVNASLLALPRLRSNSIFMVILLVTRAVLLVPHWALMSLKDSDVVKCITISGGFVVANMAMMKKDFSPAALRGSLEDGGHAIKALGWDTVLGALVYIVLGWGGGV